tara:strand:+ start:1499 stop:2695 length:1197 start_codon:yes stop_codon:yes gene_type:complete
MKILHTADWHIGKKLKGIDRILEFREVLDEISQIAIDEAVDCIIIAGDIFDSYLPTNEAEKLFEETIVQIRAKNIDIVLFPGNHDSQKKFDAKSPLLKTAGVHIVHEINFDDLEKNIISINRNNQKLQIAVVPWLNESFYAKSFPTMAMEQSINEIGKEYGTYLEYLFNELVKKLDPEAIQILTSHVLINGAVIKDADQENESSERRLSLEEVTYGVTSSQLPKKVNYIALGHIHKPQEIIHDVPVYYAGSILQFSFAEAEQQKFVYIANCHPGEKTTVRPIQLTKGTKLKELTGAYEEVIKQAADYKTEHLKITLTDEKPPKNYRITIQEQFPNVIDIRIRNKKINKIIEKDTQIKISEIEQYRNWLQETNSEKKLEDKKLAIFQQLFEEVTSNETN